MEIKPEILNQVMAIEARTLPADRGKAEALAKKIFKKKIEWVIPGELFKCIQGARTIQGAGWTLDLGGRAELNSIKRLLKVDDKVSREVLAHNLDDIKEAVLNRYDKAVKKVNDAINMAHPIALAAATQRHFNGDPMEIILHEQINKVFDYNNKDLVRVSDLRGFDAGIESRSPLDGFMRILSRIPHNSYRNLHTISSIGVVTRINIVTLLYNRFAGTPLVDLQIDMADLLTEAMEIINTKDVVYLVDRPEILKLNTRNNMHCDDGPAFVSGDYKLYCLDGIALNGKYLVAKTPQQILKVRNTEARAALIRHYGREKFVAELEHKTIEIDKERGYELVSVNLGSGFEECLYLKMRDATTDEFYIEPIANHANTIKLALHFRNRNRNSPLKLT